METVSVGSSPLPSHHMNAVIPAKGGLRSRHSRKAVGETSPVSKLFDASDTTTKSLEALKGRSRRSTE